MVGGVRLPADLEGVEVAHDLAAVDREPLDGLEHARAANQPLYSAAICTEPLAWKRQPGTVASR